MNKYKIDANIYVSSSWPFALYVKGAWWKGWKHYESFKTIEDAKAAHRMLIGLPIYL